jgi:cysteine desulfurase
MKWPRKSPQRPDELPESGPARVGDAPEEHVELSVYQEGNTATPMSEHRFIYLDSAATTPVDPRVAEVMHRYHVEEYGNASSIHRLGVAAHRAVERTRRELSDLVLTSCEGVVFTSGATEANNLAIQGAARVRGRRHRHVLVGRTEHASVLEAVAPLEKQGFEIEFLECDPTGRIEPDEVARRLRDDTMLVALMYGNNETGTVHPIRAIGRLLRSKAPPPHFHVDAVQGFPAVPLQLERDGIDSIAISAHKFHGPKGTGALVLGPDVRVEPILRGGGQEQGLRSGTENVAGIVGMGEAIRIARETAREDQERIRKLRDRLGDALLEAVPDTVRIGHPDRNLAHVLNLAVLGVPAEVLLHHLDRRGILVGTGSACSGRRQESPRHVLDAMRVPREAQRGSIRFSLDRRTTGDEIDRVIEVVPQVVASLREELGVR